MLELPDDYVDLGLFNLKHLILEIPRLLHQLLFLPQQLLGLVLILINLGSPIHLLGHIHPLVPSIGRQVLICVEHVKLHAFLEAASFLLVVMVVIEFYLVVGCQRFGVLVFVLLEVMPFHCKSVIFVDDAHQVREIVALLVAHCLRLLIHLRESRGLFDLVRCLCLLFEVVRLGQSGRGGTC